MESLQRALTELDDIFHWLDDPRGLLPLRSRLDGEAVIQEFEPDFAVSGLRATIETLAASRIRVFRPGLQVLADALVAQGARLKAERVALRALMADYKAKVGV